MIEDQRRAKLAEYGGAVTGGARRRQNGLLIQIISAEVLVHLGQHTGALDSWRNASPRRRNRETCVDRVAEMAGVTELMARRHARGVGRGECRKQRMRV